jgi:soluble lytic murein transglycosylase
MLSRHALIVLLFVAVAGGLALLGTPRETRSAPVAEAADVPPEALAALREGRYLRASLILRDYLATRPDTAAPAILLAAEAEAGWGDWAQVRRLLEGRTWLDRVASGTGRSLLARSQLELGDWRGSSESFERFLSMGDGDGNARTQGITQVRRARALAEQGRHRDAVAAYDEAASLLPLVEDWVEVFAAGAAAAAGDTSAVRERLARIDRTLVEEWGWRIEVRARRAAGDLPAAAAAALRAAERLESDGRRAAAWTLLGDVRRQQDDTRGARVAFIRAMNAAQGSTAAIEAARAMSALGSLSPADRLLIGRVYLRHGNNDRGIEGLRAYLDAGGGTPLLRERVMYDIAWAHFRTGDYTAAERSLLELAGTVQDRAVAGDALYTAARAQYRSGREGAARATLLRVIRDFGEQPAAARAAYLIADLDHDRLDLASATSFYRRTIGIAPTSAEAALARMRLVGIAMSEQRHADALRELEDYRATHPSGRSYQQATFWSARALQRLGRHVEARRRLREAASLDPFSYYGGLAAEELGDDIWAAHLEHAPPSSTRFDSRVSAALARVDLLRDIGWNEAASFEMERVRLHFARFDGALYALAEALNERGFTSSGIALGREIQRREGAWNLRLLRIVYPFPYRNIIEAEARERGVDPFLAAALIRQESMFNAAARSPVGAVGLMQVMPATGQALARRLGVPRFQPGLLAQPELNVHFGTAYLADQLRAYGDRVDLVLAAYNAGPGRVSRWRQFPEYADRLLFAERIPFDETRDYVRIVQNNRRIYRAIHGGPAAGIAAP